MRALQLALIMALACVAPAQKRSAPKPPEIEMIDASAQRQDDRLTIDGRIRNCGEKPIKRLVLLFDFLDPANVVLSTKRGSIDEEVLPPGEEREFHSQVEDNARAVAVRVNFEDGDGRELRAEKSVSLQIE